MASCANCRTTIIFGGIQDGPERYCSERCAKTGGLAKLSQQIPVEEIERRLAEIHQGTCPACKRRGPVDVHTAHSVWSALVLTRWAQHPKVCCRSCGMKQQAGYLAFSLVAGWWGFPWGLIMTPVTLGRNIAALAGSGYDPSRPSAELRRVVRLSAAAELPKNGPAFPSTPGAPPPLPPRRPGANG